MRATAAGASRAACLSRRPCVYEPRVKIKCDISRLNLSALPAFASLRRKRVTQRDSGMKCRILS